jgi:subtilisin family serine protease
MARRRGVRPPTLHRRRKVRSGQYKLDQRLAFLLSLSEQHCHQLVADETAQISRVAKEFAIAREENARRAGTSDGELRQPEMRLFAPLTTGLFTKGRYLPTGYRIKEPFISAFVRSEVSVNDLRQLGVRVRSRVGDIFSTFVPLRAIERVVESSAIQFIELARPLFPNLDRAIPFTHIDALHNAASPLGGEGVIVGIFDDVLDIYHPDFRTAGGMTRVLFLWDQTLTPQGGETGPPGEPNLPGFRPVGGASYGVDYNQAMINNELASFNPPAVPAYLTVRHGDADGAHGTHVTGIAAGNGRGQGGVYTGAAPAADIIFVASPNLFNTGLLADSTNMADAFSYIFARAKQLGRPCVVNMSNSDNQGPHDGTTLGEQFLDNLLLTPGRAITLSAGNSNGTAAHAAGNVTAGGTENLRLRYMAGAVNSDDVEVWYSGHDRFDVTVTVPTIPSTVVGPVGPGSRITSILPNGVKLDVASVLNDPRNGNNLISIIFSVPSGQSIPPGDTTIALTGSTVINGAFNAWVDRNNRGSSRFQAPHVREDQLTLGVPATARRPITVGNHDKAMPPAIDSTSGRGPTLDGRIKPEVATVGSTNVVAPGSRKMNSATLGPLYVQKRGTSMSAPLVGGVCALLFQCHGAGSTWANLKQILQDTASSGGMVIPGDAFGYGYMQVGTACSAPMPIVDAWFRKDVNDTGMEPFTGPVCWLCPDIEVLDSAGNPVANPTHDATKTFNNIIRVTARNRGSQIAENTAVYLYWADPATNLLYPGAWNATGFLTGAPGFGIPGNKIVIPQLAAGGSAQVDFAWAPPSPGSNIRKDGHFCLLGRLENAQDTFLVGAGGWSSIVAHNNLAVRNVHVQPVGDSTMAFYVVGSADQDSLTVYRDLAGGTVELILPAQALPWRDIKLIERNKGRPAFGNGSDPMRSAQASLEGEKVFAVTDIMGAKRLTLKDGIATVIIAEASALQVPYVRIADGARMIARINVRSPKVSKEHRFVHISQHSGGQLVGGVSLELRRAEARKH